METPDWEESKKQVKSFLQKTVGDLRELAAETSYMTDAATDVVKLEVAVHRLRTQIEKNHARLGREVARAATKTGAVRSTPQIKHLLAEVRELEQALLAAEENLSAAPFSWSAAKEAFLSKNISREEEVTEKKAAPKKRRKPAAKKKPEAKKDPA